MSSRNDTNPSSPFSSPWLGCAVISIACIVSGCSMIEWGSSENESLEAEANRGERSESPGDETAVASGKKIRWDGGGVLLGETHNLAYNQQSYLEAVSNLATSERSASLRDMVRQYPDIALSVLQESEPAPQNKHSLEQIAQAFDELWCRQYSTPWQSLALEIYQSSSNDQLRRRQEFWKHLKDYEPKKALSLKLVSSLTRNNTAMLRAEFYRLESIALMMSGDYAAAIDRLDDAIAFVEDDCPFLVSKLQLLLGEYYRHDQQMEKWKATWSKAVSLNSEIVAKKGSPDPMFWERAAFLRPAGMDWPPATIANLNAYLSTEDLVSESDRSSASGNTLIWMTIGHRHLERGEGQNALLTLKKAETSAGGQTETIANLRLAQARALFASGQPGAASAILIRMASQYEGKPLADRAKAVLGTMKLQNGAILQGLNLLQDSVQTVHLWPRNERLRAQADYSLALLVAGREKDGLRLLDQVQQEFLAVGKIDQAHQCLWNKAKYFEKTEKPAEHKAAIAALESLEVNASTMR